jgi:hypothetical protein
MSGAGVYCWFVLRVVFSDWLNIMLLLKSGLSDLVINSNEYSEITGRVF